MGAVKSRIIAANEYKGGDPRPARIHEGRQQTWKIKGDIILTSTGKIEVNHSGWY